MYNTTNLLRMENLMNRLVSLVFDVLSLGSLLIVLLHPHLYHILPYPIFLNYSIDHAECETKGKY